MSRDISPGLRANFSLRISMKLMAQNESKRILHRVGAERLSNEGELVYEQWDKLVKGMQPYIDHEYMDSLCDYIGSQQGYVTAYLLPEPVADYADSFDFDMRDRDHLFEDAARLIVMHQQGSTSLIQRKLKLGINRAGKIIDQLEAAGIIGPFEGSHAREVLYPDEYSLEKFLKTLITDNGRTVSSPSIAIKPKAKRSTSPRPAKPKKFTASTPAELPKLKSSHQQADTPQLGSPEKKKSNVWAWLLVVGLALLLYYLIA